MTTSWGSLYLPCADQEQIAATLREALAADGYTLYDPFGLLPGRAYPHSVRLFVAPPAGDWVRVCGQPVTSICAALSRLGLCLSLELDGEQAVIDVFEDGAQTDPETALIPYLRAGRSAAHLAHVLTAAHLPDTAPQDAPDSIFDQLPADMQAMGDHVDRQQAQQMFDRLSGGLLKKMGQRTGTDSDTMGEAARGLLGGSVPDWHSPGGTRIRALMACLTMPDDWREPDFVALRDAYQLHSRRRRNPNARLYPGDAEAMERVPDALDYIPVYGGRD